MAGIQFKNNRLRELREKKGLSLRALSEKTGVDFSTIAFCEKGQRNFSANSLAALSSFFGVSVDYLLGKTPEEVYTGFLDSLRRDYDLDPSSSLDDKLSDVPEPIRTKLSILFLVDGISSPESLRMIYELAKLRSAYDDFGGGRQ